MHNFYKAKKSLYYGIEYLVCYLGYRYSILGIADLGVGEWLLCFCR